VPDTRDPAPVATEPTEAVNDAGGDSGAQTSGASLGDTAGTGTIIAIGCITGTIFIIVLGLVYLLVTQLLG
jgi:hypothetical protein